jgi:uncharacterized hydrophobic protein (TIGR00271 family)
MLSYFFPIEQRERQEALDKLIQHSSPRRDFFVLTLLSGIMACAGLVTDNGVYIIASMLIAPVLYPLLSLAMGLVAMDGKLVSRSLFSVFVSFVLVIVAAFLFGTASQPSDIGLEIVRRILLTPYEWIVAIVAGIAASLATSKPHLNEAFPGVAIAVSIVPPLSVIGLGLAWSRVDLVSGAGSVLLTNTLAIVVSSIVIFSSQGFLRQSKATNKALEKDELPV